MQAQAAATINGPLLLLAGAGSGKTRVLIYRMAYMVSSGISPFNILAITFTNKAAREMKERTAGIVRGGENIWVSTFHSFCCRVLRRDIDKIGMDKSFTILDADDSLRLMKTIIKELNVNDKQFPAKSVLGEIGRQKDELIGPAEYELLAGGDFRLAIIAKLYKSYQSRLKTNNSLDFDDIINKTIELFSSCPEVLERYQNRFQYIMVDEYQDTNTAQYQLIRLLSAKHRNLCVVGDDDQSIYGWRGANIHNILNFEKDFVNAVTIKLEQNYRSTNVILDAANAVIQNNKGRKGKVLWTEQQGGTPIHYQSTPDEYTEAEFIADTIETAYSQGTKYKDFAILYRLNAQSRVVEEKLVRRNIRYRIFGGVRFYERKEVKDVLAYLKTIANPYDEVSLRRIINVPRRGIGDVALDAATGFALTHDLPLYESFLRVSEYSESSARNKNIAAFTTMMEDFQQQMPLLSVSELLKFVLDKSNYLLTLQTENTDEARDRIKNVEELISKAVEFEKNSTSRESLEPGEIADDNKSLAAFLEEVALIADIDNYDENEDAVSLMTLHSSKGLEFPQVFIAGFEENVFPSYRAVFYGGEKEIEEERRLCYVGITRAKQQLYLLSSIQRRQNGMMVYNNPSRFLNEIPEDLVVGKATKKPLTEPKPIGNFDFMQRGTATKPATTVKPAAPLPTPKLAPPDYGIGDTVRQAKYGIGEVLDIKPSGRDYEVTVRFPEHGAKKFMAHLSKLEKVT